MQRGGFYPESDDRVPDLPQGAQAKTLLLFGNAGSSIWRRFSESGEYQNGRDEPHDHPLDRWSERIGKGLARRWQGQALFPFGGPPYQPFIGWAQKAENLRPSKLGMLLHPGYGLWHAYRFAIALPNHVDGVEARSSLPPDRTHACDGCVGRPCLKTCPVNAFDGERYDVERCFHYLRQHPDAPCHRQGCQARAACPEGKGYRYEESHAAFHMKKFYQSLQRRFQSED